MTPSNDMGLYPEVPHILIAALRLLQNKLDKETYSWDMIVEIMTLEGTYEAPMPEDIEDLIQAINLGQVELIGEIW